MLSNHPARVPFAQIGLAGTVASRLLFRRWVAAAPEAASLMDLFVQRMVAVLVSASVLFTGVHCACASSVVKAEPLASAAAHVKSCCSDRSGGHPEPSPVPCDSHGSHRTGCQHCPLVVEAKVRPTDSWKAAPASDVPPLSPALGSPCCDVVPPTSTTAGDLSPPRDGRTVLRLHCTLVQ